MAGTFPNWIEEEDAIIRRSYPKLGIKGTTRLLHEAHYMRTEGAVKMRAKALGIKRDRTKMEHDGAWSDAEIAILRDQFPKGGVEAVIENLSKFGYTRTEGAIMTRAALLGVKNGKTTRRMKKGGDKIIVNLCMDTVLDRDIIDELYSKRNRSQYVRELVAADMMAKKGGKS